MEKETTKKATSTAKAKTTKTTKTAKATKKENNVNKKTITPEEIVHAQITAIWIPEELQTKEPKYPNYQLYINTTTNTIQRSFDYETHNGKPSLTANNKKIYIRDPHTNKIQYKTSNLIQILWTTTTGNLFLTTYNPRTKITETFHGENNITITQQIEKDYIRDYLLRALATQHNAIDLNKTNASILNTMLKHRDEITYQFTKILDVNGEYLNYKYFPKYIHEDELPTNTEEPCITELPEDIEL